MTFNEYSLTHWTIAIVVVELAALGVADIVNVMYPFGQAFWWGIIMRIVVIAMLVSVIRMARRQRTGDA